MKVGLPKVSMAVMPHAPTAGEGLPSAGMHGPAKPRFRARHISIGGKSAFPPAPQAFGSSDSGPTPQAAFSPPPSGAGPGEAGY